MKLGTAKRFVNTFCISDKLSHTKIEKATLLILILALQLVVNPLHYNQTVKVPVNRNMTWIIINSFFLLILVISIEYFIFRYFLLILFLNFRWILTFSDRQKWLILYLWVKKHISLLFCLFIFCNIKWFIQASSDGWDRNSYLLSTDWFLNTSVSALLSISCISFYQFIQSVRLWRSRTCSNKPTFKIEIRYMIYHISSTIVTLNVTFCR